MSANVETMFSVRETPWHGLGRIVMDAPASREALELAGLDWQVESRNIYSGTGAMIPGYTYNENLQKMFRAEQALYDTYERILNNFGLAE